MCVGSPKEPGFHQEGHCRLLKRPRGQQWPLEPAPTSLQTSASRPSRAVQGTGRRPGPVPLGSHLLTRRRQMRNTRSLSAENQPFSAPHRFRGAVIPLALSPQRGDHRDHGGGGVLSGPQPVPLRIEAFGAQVLCLPAASDECSAAVTPELSTKLLSGRETLLWEEKTAVLRFRQNFPRSGQDSPRTPEFHNTGRVACGGATWKPPRDPGLALNSHLPSAPTRGPSSSFPKD